MRATKSSHSLKAHIYGALILTPDLIPSKQRLFKWIGAMERGKVGMLTKEKTQVLKLFGYKPYLNKGKQIVIVGANFSSELRNISDWKGALLSESGEKVKDLLP